MNTTPDIENVLFQLLHGSALAAGITGKIYQGDRPPGSVLEDVVVNSLPVTAGQLQRAVGNVNIFVPDIRLTKGTVVWYERNTERLNTLAKLAIIEVTDKYINGYYLDLQQQQIYADEGNNQHFVNLRIDFFIPNI